jgi:glycosyltransferase involved in cell wall biosynthesis
LGHAEGDALVRLRIAHVTATFPPYQAGTGLVAFHNAVELARRGHNVHVFTAAVANAPAEETIDNVRVHRLRPIFRIGNAPLLPGLPGALRGFDLIHLHYPFISGAELVRLAAWRGRTPLILSFHNDLIGAGGRAPIFHAYQLLSAHLTARHADLLCVVSQDHYDSTKLAATLGRHAPPVAELPNGVDIHAFSPGDGAAVRQRYGIPPAVPLGLFVAALDRAHHMKGLDRLLEAMARFEIDMVLLVVGDGDLRSTYQAQAQSLGLTPRVLFAGIVENKVMPDFYRSADFTILPSFAESFGIIFIESMACATPVIAGNVPGARTVVTDCVDGYYTDPLDIGEIATKIKAIISLSADERQAMGLAGRRKVEAHYSWQRIGDILEELYAEVTEKPVTGGIAAQSSRAEVRR